MNKCNLINSMSNIKWYERIIFLLVESNLMMLKRKSHCTLYDQIKLEIKDLMSHMPNDSIRQEFINLVSVSMFEIGIDVLPKNEIIDNTIDLVMKYLQDIRYMSKYYPNISIHIRYVA